MVSPSSCIEQGGLFDQRILEQLPENLVTSLRASPNADAYLTTLAVAALEDFNGGHATQKIFALYEPIIVDLASRWLSLAQTQPAAYLLRVVSAFSRILPFARYLRSFAQISVKPEAGIIDVTKLHDGAKFHFLLALFRLLSFDIDFFSVAVSPNHLQSLFQHEQPVIRYVAIRCFTLYIHAADAATQAILKTYTGTGALEGPWEDRRIDYRFLSLWEERRWIDFEKELNTAREGRDNQLFRDWIDILQGVLTSRSVDVGGVVVPTMQVRAASSSQSTLVRTPTVSYNLEKLGRSLLSNDPILLCGLPGSGKTTLVNYAADVVGQSNTMVTLHLNEQTDSKSLLGVYSTSAQVGSFSWQPGVLTQAAREGRWVLIEDLDRAPAEVLGLVLPLIEKRELVIPSRKETIKCAEGFRVLATMRTMLNARGEETTPGAHMLGNRLWNRIAVKSLPLDEVADIIAKQFPLLSVRIKTVMAMYERLGKVMHGDIARKSLQGRMPGLRDLIKLCSRTQRRLRQLGCTTGQEPIPQSLDVKIFKDAVDCFAAYLPNGPSKDAVCAVIAEELQIDPERANYCLYGETPVYTNATNNLTVGRETCHKRKLNRKPPSNGSIFAPTRPSLQTMEQVAAALQLAEPLLLVGETGIGKTAVIQQLAGLLNQRLTVVNLSQQSESTDLLGGFKPVNLRTLAVPLVDEFYDLFDATFSAKKNQKFLNSVKKAVSHGNWSRLINILKEAVKMASGIFAKKAAKNNDEMELDDQQQQQQPSKKRRFDDPKYVALCEKWDGFNHELNEFEARSAQGDSGFAFAFVQGKIVKALRNGEWVLLDEINLASPDTLESIASLLHYGGDGSPSVLLSEAGEVERIYGHPNFRIFGAMNPATDAGKRDLAPGLRSRFTELYVNSPDTHIHDLIALIEAYLGPLSMTDQLAPAALAQLYLDTKKLNSENRLTDGAGQKPHFSIRTLVRTLVYVRDQASVYGLRRALYEGFCMSFLTLLSKDSEALVMPYLDKHIFGTLKNAKSLLSQTPKPPQDGQSYVRYKHYWMRQGAFPPEKQPHYIITPFIERNLMNLVRASSTRRFPILLQGPTSAGKTSMVEYLAKVSGNRFVRINNHEHTDLQEYLGTYVSGEDGNLRYQEGVLVEALRNGYWIVLDELNLAPTDVLEALNRLLDDNRELFLPEIQEVVHPHPNFMLFATQNPAGLYGGRKILSRAFRNRFLELHFDDIPEDELEFILKERSQIAPSFCSRIVTVYKRLSLLRQMNRLFEQRNSFATLRDLFRWSLRKADDREQLAANGFMLLAERVRNPQEREAVKKIIEEVMKVKLNDDNIYSSQALEFRLRQAGLAPPTGIIWTRAMRRVFLLISHAIENNEPVLLVGETGCGKTQICQAIAEAYRRHLHVINAHVNLETGDLIGAQRPVRNRAAIEDQLLTDLKLVFGQIHGIENVEGVSLTDLTAEFAKLDAVTLQRFDPELLSRIKENAVKAKSLFQWCNGSLVTAMETGQHFLLDEVSLADDSVLERLNSVLEPSRSILLAEKGPVDSNIVAAEGFQFLATMNPGGDYGKRELSAALRNRLTEIWVPQLSEAEDILPILESKLERATDATPRAMLEYAKWFKGRFQGSSTESMSIRDLLSWVNFVNNCKVLDLSGAIVHGAALVYIDTLGANPSALLAASTGTLENDRLEALQKLGAFFAIDAVNIYFQRVDISIGDSEMKIGPFALELGNNSRQDPTFALDAPTTLSNALRVARGLQSAKPILLEGSPGVGKTTLIATLAQVLGKPLTRINLSEQTDLTDLFGSDVPVEGGEMGNFAWSDAPFLRALQNGGWVLLDEMNLASQSVLEGLNSCLDHRQEVYIAELDQTFKRHDDFVLFAAQNPHHQGGGRKGLPASFANRFTVVYADSFSDHDLRIICRKISSSASTEEIERMVHFLSVINRVINERRLGLVGGPWEINLRDISRWLKLLERTANRVEPYHFLDVIISGRFRSASDRDQVMALYRDVFSSSPNPKSYFHNLSEDWFQVGLGMVQRQTELQNLYDPHMQITKHDLPVMETLMLCVDQGWPSILVGPSGCGKTSTLRKLAAVSGASMVELSLNADTDTMDLVGGFEQADSHRHILVFMEELLVFLQAQIVRSLMSKQASVSDLIQLHHIVKNTPYDIERVSKLLLSISQTAGTSEYMQFYDRSCHLTEVSGATTKVGFEWTEGLFIQAIQQGRWVVLDNANLCNPSVLDRLNSLMEPHGSLIINEQRTSDGSAKEVKPHPNFRLFLTMDPRHGELSRAMRNRAIEVCFISEEACSDIIPSGIAYGTESSLYRLRPCHTLASLNFNDSQQLQAFYEVMLDHSSHADEHALGQSSLTLPLWNSSPESLGQVLERYETLSPDLFRAYGRFHSYSGTHSVRYALDETEPLNALVNEPRLAAYVAPENHDQILFLTKLQELQIELFKFHQCLGLVNETASSKKPSEMTPLERSFMSSRISSLRKESTHASATFLLGCCKAIGEWIQQSARVITVNLQAVVQTRSILDFCWDIFNLLQSDTFDEGIFQGYLQNAWSWISSDKTASLELIGYFSRSLEAFDADWGLSTGKSMQRLWNKWRPVTAKNPSQLQLLLELQSISSRFDGIALNTRLPLPRLADIRTSLIMSQDAVLSGADDSGLVESLDNVITDLEKHLSDLNNISDPFFSAEFEALSQYYSLPDHVQSTLLSSLHVLAARPSCPAETSNLSSQMPGLLYRISSFAGFRSPHKVAMALQGTLPLSITKKLASTKNVPLKAMDLLKVEFELLSRGLASSTRLLLANQTEILQQCLKTILREVIVCHEDMFTEDSVKRALCLVCDGHVLDEGLQLCARGDCEDQDHVLSLAQQDLERCFKTLSNSIGEGDQGIGQSGMACVEIALTCLRLFVPNKPFDPSLDLVVQRQRHESRVQDKSRRLDSLQAFEGNFTGQASTLRIRMAEEELRLLGDSPPLPSVVRPQPSKLAQLQGEFSNIVTAVLSSDMKEVFASDGSMELMQKNVRQLCSRLSDNYAAYNDVVIPVVRFLEIFDLGISLVRQSMSSQSFASKYITAICEVTPFLTHTPPAVHNYNGGTKSHLDLMLLVHRVAAMGVLQTTDENTLKDVSYRRMLYDDLGRLHASWKEQLNADQEKEAERTRTYRYRGSAEDEEQVDEGELRELFPTYDDNEDPGVQKAVSPTSHVASHAHKISTSIGALFFTADKESHLTEFIKESARLIGSALTDASLSTLRADPSSHLSGVLLLLDQATSPSAELFNFYADQNDPEVRKLSDLVTKIQLRFTELLKQWPDHAALADVLICCAEIFEFSHEEPLAKFITKAEKLHGLVYQWQLVASRQYTAAGLYDDLTALLISWRRLELTTWARLFNLEKDKCEKDASSWWFIAYEVIIAAPLQLAQEGSALNDHCLELVSTLEKFISSTPMGQFAARMRLLDQFVRLLDLYCRDFPACYVILSSLQNVYRHYSPFIPVVEKALADSRQGLEKEVQEVIKLASWKDTNITALRESARRSHRKLFKYVRKFRELLAQPSDGIISSGSADVSSGQPLFTAEACLPDLSSLVTTSQAICMKSLETWSTRPARFHDPLTTAKNMSNVYTQAVTSLDVSEEIELFLSDTMETINDLKARTPKTLTEDNKSEVQHLKAQKRRVYADKLKALRLMGVRMNLTTDVLERQATSAAVLASTPSLETPSDVSFVVSENYFHRLLDLVPGVRTASRNYAEDLSNVEVARSVGSVEGMLHWLMKQREVLAIRLEEVSSLTSVVGQAINVSTLSPNGICHDLSSCRNFPAIQRALRWLVTLVGVTRNILNIHARFAGTTIGEILEQIEKLRSRLAAASSALEQQPSLPGSMSTTTRMACFSEAVASIQEAKSVVSSICEVRPDLAFALKAILPWTSPALLQNLSEEDVPSATSSEFEASVIAVANKIFVALQRVSSASVSISTEMSSWLLKSDQLLAKSLAELQMSVIAGDLASLLGQMQRIPEKSGELTIAGALLGAVSPIIQQYRHICAELAGRYVNFNHKLSKMAYMLAKSFSQIASEGFCSPAGKDTEQGKSDKLESGTGLGEGEGEEDISKDVQDDEDLSDLAQEKQKMDGEKEDMDEENEDAVNMDQQEMEADRSDFEKEDDENGDEGDEGEENDIDEETGSVNNLDADDVDEKMWDGEKDEDQKETDNNQGKGTNQSDDKSAAADQKQDKPGEEEAADEDNEEDEGEEAPEDEGEAVGAPDETEMVDPQAKEEQVLDLPEDMDLDGQNEGEDNPESDDGMDDLSDIEQEGQDTAEQQQEDDVMQDTEEDPQTNDNEQRADAEEGPEDEAPEEEETQAGKEAELEAQEDDGEEGKDEDNVLKAENEEQAAEEENVAPSEAVSGGVGVDQDQNKEKGSSGEANQETGAEEEQDDQEREAGKARDGEGAEASQQAGGHDNDTSDATSAQAFQKLGDIFEEWHKRQREIKQASEQDTSPKEQGEDVDMQEVDFEHLKDENDTADTQALGQANEEQAKGLDQRKAVESNEKPEDENVMPLPDEPEESPESQTLEDQMEIEQTSGPISTKPTGSFIASERKQDGSHAGEGQQVQDADDLDDVDASLSHLHVSSEELIPLDEARRLWSHYESVTHDLSLSLTEQLRLILAPTMATKLRGDFRTGKRLNIKRIIPYIASQYKRDKIWMRRSVPSKRSYQIMLSVDDSKSMLESGSGQLAFETLAMVAKSLSMLEVGDLCVVGFGNQEHIRVAHEFGKTFSSEAGTRIFQQFSFKQTGTNVRQLIKDSIALFREARNQRSRGSGSADLWQLQLVISDGICEDHETIRRLVRQAQEERIMIVFIIVDAVKGSSILDLTQARFEPDTSNNGEMKLKMTRYLEGFPFAYYLVVRDVQELPAILSMALKQWFAEVVDISG